MKLVLTVLARGQAGHACDPLALAKALSRLTNEAEDAVPFVRLEDLRRSILGVVVCGNDKIDAGV